MEKVLDNEELIECMRGNPVIHVRGSKNCKFLERN